MLVADISFVISFVNCDKTRTSESMSMTLHFYYITIGLALYSELVINSNMIRCYLEGERSAGNYLLI